jgi:hypothetical protein
MFINKLTLMVVDLGYNVVNAIDYRLEASLAAK